MFLFLQMPDLIFENDHFQVSKEMYKRERSIAPYKPLLLFLMASDYL